MAKLNLSTTRKISSGKFQKFFIYGLPGSGKTHFAGSFPDPLFITPKATQTELQTYGDQDFTIARISTMQDTVDTVNTISESILKGKKIGDYKPQTIIIDNLTEIQNMIEHELTAAEGRGNTVAGQKIMGQREWGALSVVLMHMRTMLYKLTDHCHIIWIAHAVVQSTTEVVNGKSVSRDYGTWTLRGGAKNFIPNNCHILYAESIPKARRTAYYVHAEPKGIWPARIHFPSGSKRFSRLGFLDKKPDELHPVYDDIAPYFGLDSLEEAESD